MSRHRAPTRLDRLAVVLDHHVGLLSHGCLATAALCVGLLAGVAAGG